MDGDGKNSPFTAALIKYLAMPGLDLRIAFGRVRDDVLKATSNQQEPFVYGSLGGDVVSLVRTPEPKVVAPGITITDNIAEARRDYEFVERMGTKEAWTEFLRLHPSGLYANLARAQLAKLQAANNTVVAEQAKDSISLDKRPSDKSTTPAGDKPADLEVATLTPNPTERNSTDTTPPAKLTAKEIVVSWVETQRGVRPSRTYRLNKNVRLTLQGNNSISEIFSSVSDTTRTRANDGKIGIPINAALSWNVQDTNTLIRTLDQPQNLLTIRVTVGVSNSCSAQISYRLKPGFSEYQLRSMKHPGQFVYFSSISVQQISCKSTISQSNISAYAR